MRHQKKQRTRRRKVSKKPRPRLTLKSTRVAPKTAAELFSKPKRFKNLWDKVLDVISQMRNKNVSLRKASREIGIDPRSVVRQGGSALQKSAKGRYSAKPSDSLLRVLMVPTPQVTREIAV